MNSLNFRFVSFNYFIHHYYFTSLTKTSNHLLKLISIFEEIGKHKEKTLFMIIVECVTRFFHFCDASNFNGNFIIRIFYLLIKDFGIIQKSSSL